VTLHGCQNDSGYDFEINGLHVRVKWIGECGLRQVREMLVDSSSRPAIVVARRASPGAREELSKAGIGWVDESGAAEIVLGQLIVSKSGRPDDRLEKPPKWTPSVLAVAEAILCDTKPTVAATSKITTLSPAICTYALRTLTDLQLLTSSARRGRESARQISSIPKLLDAYAAAATAATQRRPISLTVGATWRDILSGLSEVGKKWQSAGKVWAATGSAAASVMAPYLTSVTAGEVYIDADTIPGLEAAALDVGLRPIDGGRITLMPFPTTTSKLLLKNEKGLNVAPWPRVYCDLRRLGVRGEEAAEHLREVLHG
jgi:hypothetical protein